jgi:hypothetical protein
MVIKWKGPAQHTDKGLVRPGEVIDTAERGLPDEAAKVWIRDGDAEEVKHNRAARKSGSEEV